MAEGFDLRDWIDAVEAIVAGHQLARPGAYRRWNAHALDPERDLGVNPYGCADAVNILYTIGRLPGEPAQRLEFVETLQDQQSAEDGLFHEATHDPVHTTAHCVAALELLDAKPRHALSGLVALRDPARMEAFLAALDWQSNPWTEAHKGAGLYAALVIAEEVDSTWESRYFAWLARESDPDTGLWRKGVVEALPQGDASVFPHLAGSFHYLFNLEYRKQPLAHPDALVDTCLAIWERRLFPFSRFVGFAEVDWIYCLSRASRQSRHRQSETQAALTAFAQEYVNFLLALDPEKDDGLNDLHRLFGALCALAELQQALPGVIGTSQPLRLVLDRRPFI